MGYSNVFDHDSRTSLLMILFSFIYVKLNMEIESKIVRERKEKTRNEDNNQRTSGARALDYGSGG
jgi:hypothetical protein